MKNVKQKFAQSTGQKYLLIRFNRSKNKINKKCAGSAVIYFFLHEEKRPINCAKRNNNKKAGQRENVSRYILLSGFFPSTFFVVMK